MIGSKGSLIKKGFSKYKGKFMKSFLKMIAKLLESLLFSAYLAQKRSLWLNLKMLYRQYWTWKTNWNLKKPQRK